MADLHQGDHGPEVLKLKAGLRRRGYPPVHDDDAFDDDTAAVLRVFQRSRNLDADGVADEPTWRALREKDDIPQWFARYGGALSIPLVALGVLIAIGICTALAAVAHRILLLLGLHDLPIEIYGFSLVCVLLSLWLLIGPALTYVYSGQVRKIEVIRGFYSPDLIARYFDHFWRGRDGFAALVRRWRAQRPNLSADLTAELELAFADLFRNDFGSGTYLLPSILLAAVGFIVLFFGYAGGIALAETLLSAPNPPPIKPLGLQVDLVSVAAIFGAFTWIVSDSITRNHQGTFHPSDLSWYALRLIIAVPLGEAIAVFWHGVPMAGGGAAASGLLGTATGAFLAFVISMFSLDGITRILSSMAVKAGVLPTTTPEERNDVVVKLPGVDEEKAHALGVEGVTTIAQLIAVDPVRTSIRTGLPFEYVLGLVDAALLWRYFGTRLEALREFGFIGASQILNFAEAQHPTQIVARAAQVARAAAEVEACGDAVSAAIAALDQALAALVLPAPTLAAVQTELQQINVELAAPDLPATDRTRLQQRQAVLNAAVARSDQLDRAAADREAANDTLSDHETALLAAVPIRPRLIAAIAAKMGSDADGIDNVMNQLAQDSYADFIRRLLTP
jgi:hypothetical protein